MKKTWLTLMLALVAAVGFSQVRFDVRAGMSMYNLTKADMDLKVGYTVGLGMDVPVNEMFSVQTGLMFTGKGAKIDGLTCKPHYMDIPVLAALKLPVADDVKFVINAGPYFSVGLGGKIEADSGIDLGDFWDGTADTDYFGDYAADRFDVGLQYGIGAEFADHILLNLSGQYGFISPFDGSDSKNLGFVLSLGYRF